MILNSDQKYFILFFLLLLIPVVWMTIGMYPTYSQQGVDITIIGYDRTETIHRGMGNYSLLESLGFIIGIWVLFLVLLLPMLSESKKET